MAGPSLQAPATGQFAGMMAALLIACIGTSDAAISYTLLPPNGSSDAQRDTVRQPNLLCALLNRATARPCRASLSFLPDFFRSMLALVKQCLCPCNFRALFATGHPPLPPAAQFKILTTPLPSMHPTLAPPRSASCNPLNLVFLSSLFTFSSILVLLMVTTTPRSSRCRTLGAA
jgi:hypothetical protein